MWIVWDIISIIIIALCVHIGAKRGFVRTLLSLVYYVAAALIARTTGPIVSEFIYDNYLSNRIVEIVLKALNDGIQAGIASVPELLTTLPPWIHGIILSVFPEASTITLEAFMSNTGQGQVAQVARSIEVSISQPIVQFLGWIGFLVVFILLITIFKFIARAFTGVNYIPGIGSVNMALGGVIGGVQSLIILLLAVIVLNTVGVIAGSDLPLLNPETVQSSLIMGNIYRFVFG